MNMQEEQDVFTVNPDNGLLVKVKPSVLTASSVDGVAFYHTAVEALEAAQGSLVKEIKYKGRDIEYALNRADVLKAQRAQDALVLSKVRSQLAEVISA